MSRRFLNLILLLAVALGLGNQAFAAPTPILSISITGSEQSSGGIWDEGTVTATLNGVSISIPYGQYSSPASIASGLAATISQDCNMPIFAQANGATINFYAKGTNTLSSAMIASASSNPSLFPSDSFLVNGGGTWSPPLPSIAQACVQQNAGTCTASGFYGAIVTITGQNFGSTPGTVSLNGTALPLVTGTGWGGWGNTTIYAYVPAGASSGPITVTTSVGSARSSAFTVGGSCCGH